MKKIKGLLFIILLIPFFVTGCTNDSMDNIEVIVMYNGEVHLFDLNLGINAYNISEVDSNIWKLSEINNKKNIK